MTSQLKLTLGPAARKTDPKTSHKAADHATRSGFRLTQAQVVFGYVLGNPGKTSAELAEMIGYLDRFQVARRLPDLEKNQMVTKGPARVCAACRKESVTWLPTTNEKDR